jgi:predicted AlkP superfamily phosphohydrolase/phosphomutase
LSVFDPRNLKGLKLKGDDDIDWFRSYAYAIGFNGVFLNQFGRQTSGKVTDRDKEEWLTKIERALLAWVDPKTGKNVVSRVYRPEEIYSGPFLGNAPDLVIGYARGYRASDATAQGYFGKELIEDNMDPWSGDHMMAAEEVPGILLSNRKIAGKTPRLVDMPVTILKLFGIDKPEPMTGENVLAR